ncbi:lasso peptide biosynthesis PqqD family chaperone [Litchfieldia salsa]|uniref:Coenzyme PQQ synthesis protein D (PqqD) n=1 Tax=Litchfieldia salsa TaxID=930152 RepID=A0A1H0VFJ9_9BACI|nr:lasso peptide biosynthesis PqqD family chaperone [Litchfieldia salsa]SDP76988.1 Coenzyme PQQ synthesis protein D (PqqD) [Litchfieldia salsa]
MISSQLITVKTTVNQGKGNIVSDMGGEKVMLSVSKGKYYNLGDIGGEIWDLIADPIPVSDVIEKLMTVYQVEVHVCEEQVLSFLDHLSHEGLIEIHN